ncbi:MAG: T9SS type A sorting domain-containing protein [Bacteroidota bacterium]
MAIGFLGLYKENTVIAQSLARSAIGSTGASVEANDIQLDFSVGEVAVTRLESPEIVLTQGFLQSERIVTGVDELPVFVSLRVYPNPFSKTLEISLKGAALSFHLAIYDGVGRSLKGFERTVETYGHWQERLDLTQQPPGIYTLLIANPGGTWTKTYKVVKQ